MRVLEPKRLAVLGAVVLGAGILAACNPPKQPPPPPPTMVDDDGQAAPGDCDATTSAATTIGAALSSAADGTHVDVCPGVYAEQLTIPSTKHDLTLTSTQPRAATIKAPATMAEPGDIIRVDGGSNLTITGFVISEPLPNTLFCSTESRTGLFVANGGSVTVEDNRFEEIRAADPSLRGCQNGIAIRVGRQATPTFGMAMITNNEFATYQKGAIVIDGSGSSATIGLNQVTGEGGINYIAQNGIQVSRNATANVASNTVSGHHYTGNPANGSSTGVLIFQAGSGLVVNNNNVHHNDDNIDLITVTGAVVRQNAAQNSTLFDGLFADSDTSGNQFIENVATGNMVLDCEDLSTAVAVPPVANTWSGDTGTTQAPPGICTPPINSGPGTQQSQAQARAAAARRVVPIG